MLKTFTVIVDLSVSSFGYAASCFMYVEVPLIGKYKLRSLLFLDALTLILMKYSTLCLVILLFLKSMVSDILIFVFKILGIYITITTFYPCIYNCAFNIKWQFSWKSYICILLFTQSIDELSALNVIIVKFECLNYCFLFVPSSSSLLSSIELIKFSSYFKNSIFICYFPFFKKIFS